jgi:hypothetical protein
MMRTARPRLGRGVVNNWVGVAGLSVLLATAAASVALAQQPKPHPKPKPKSSATDSDNPYGTEPVASSAASAGDAGAGPVPAPPRLDVGDGGTKPSPLNPAGSEMPAAPGAAPASSTGVDYDKLLSDIATLRARVAAVGDNLFVSRISISARTDGDHGRIARLVVSLDDGVVYTAPQAFHAEDETTVYEHAVAPGRHAVTVDIDRRDDRDDSFRTSQRSRFIVDVPKDQRLNVALRIDDDSNMGGSFPADKSGKYDLRVRMKASAGAAAAKK